MMAQVTAALVEHPGQGEAGDGGVLGFGDGVELFDEVVALVLVDLAGSRASGPSKSPRPPPKAFAGKRYRVDVEPTPKSVLDTNFVERIG